MRYLEVIYLIKKIYSKDAIGNMVSKKSEKAIFAKLNNVSTKEFYSAIESGIKPIYEFQIRSSNYEGEDEIRYKNDLYHLIRTIRKSNMDLVLVVERKAGEN